MFRAAALKVDSAFIDVMSVAMFCAVGGYVGVPFGLLGLQLNRIKTKKLWVAVAAVFPPAIGFVAATNFLIREITVAVDEMVKVGLMG